MGDASDESAPLLLPVGTRIVSRIARAASRTLLGFDAGAVGEVVLGSTRSGLLVGAPPSWGTRTGFYSADFQDHDRLPPETIRKANLQRADLRGAHVLECDFYLVDLRGAAFTHEQGQHFRKCGAILDRRPD